MVSNQQSTGIHYQLSIPGAARVRRFEDDRTGFGIPTYPTAPQTPSEWFQARFPTQVKTYGCPFLEYVQPLGDGFDQITPLAINMDFFAGILSGDPKLGHQVIYIESECAFYFLDPRDNLFRPVNQDKLASLIRAYFIHCAEEMPNDVNKVSLFAEFRSDKTLQSILHRAKSILAADDEFFGESSNHRRQQKAPDTYERVARAFVEQVIERQPGEVLTLTEAYAHFCEYLRRKNLPVVRRKEFKALVPPVVQEHFDLGVRHDLRNPDSNEWHCGWKGIRALELGSAGANN